jgi:hypothetical protein
MTTAALHRADAWPTAQAFAGARPFPHTIMDRLWDHDLLQAAAREFPDGADPRWTTYGHPRERGKRAGGPEMWGPAVQAYMDAASSPAFIAELEQVTGIRGLVADHTGGGMHLTGPGGRLGIHRDFLAHPALPLRRCLNLLTFLAEPGWQCPWGGCLHLGQAHEAIIRPTFGRTVLFATSETSWHGHPEPIIGDHWRPSLAVYYYTPADPDAAPDSTVFAGGDGSDQ